MCKRISLKLSGTSRMYGDVDFHRDALRALVDGIVDAKVLVQTGYGYGERTPEQVTHGTGCRTRARDTWVGTIDPHIPKSGRTAD